MLVPAWLIWLALAALAALFLARGGAAEAASWGASTMVFLALAGVAVTAVAVPAPYEALADVGLRAAGLHGRLRALDEGLARVEDAVTLRGLAERTGELAAQLGRALGAPEEAPGAPPADAAAGAPDDAPGLVEGALYPGLVGLVALVLRAGALAASLAGMLAALALGAAARAARAARALRARTAELEARVAALEGRAAPPR